MVESRVEPVSELPAPVPASIDPLEFRGVLGHFATGVAAVTGVDAGTPVGLLVNSFTSVSLDPPLVAFCVAHTSTSWSRLRRGERHCICFLAADQQEQGLRLAGRGVDKFRDVDWSPSPSGLPVLDGALAWLECAVEAEHPAGDHVIVVARVHHLARSGDDARTEPLLFYRGRWTRLPGA
ncbi:flavin reductase family protein [Micromonospora harpali]|nr:MULTISPECIES: flavin reductase family protein [unclassified Micromonospora]MDI5937814.1 flavin reductase family protein [Micromonospora sp. DH15]